ncbi:hypothetical protein AVEN_139666-1 [Araneus ventricosus]|uniref:Uncharacterized protein n=1 Tax=Araneus ventricosus TaxID=182803 RepID=A0A4Y2QYS7_ARAVE|nr:hypothetical protein AVEN_211499-1 [Araneus ventricosus]GBN68452.1 hypothetical protein AVEN_60761-1 [Araneus ventricosus]GBN68461.1 hypothetical protein AVEN_139666-1 [Araneus ventricosus]
MNLPPLPEDLVMDAGVFEVSGVDLAGPLFLRDGSKTWIALLTCAVYRAIQLELLSSMSTKNFLCTNISFVNFSFAILLHAVISFGLIKSVYTYIKPDRIHVSSRDGDVVLKRQCDVSLHAVGDPL